MTPDWKRFFLVRLLLPAIFARDMFACSITCSVGFFFSSSSSCCFSPCAGFTSLLLLLSLEVLRRSPGGFPPIIGLKFPSLPARAEICEDFFFRFPFICGDFLLVVVTGEVVVSFAVGSVSFSFFFLASSSSFSFFFFSSSSSSSSSLLSMERIVSITSVYMVLQNTFRLKERRKGSSIINPISWIPNNAHVTSAITGTAAKPSSPTTAMGNVRHQKVKNLDV
mmetsp:Transcript_45174/g.72649  ORF Transcript_45174/g.72649 Transcript_45174/m.72649 type:complete len:223 (-) Transcript_45174:894-1562(-)